MKSYWRLRANWKVVLLTSLMGVLLIVLLFGCASGPVSTPEDLTPPVATPADAGTGASSGVATVTPTLGDPVSTSEDITPPAATPTDTAPASSSGVATPTLMDIVAADTRHFIGDPNAPVTIVEFGDFQ